MATTWIDTTNGLPWQRNPQLAIIGANPPRRRRTWKEQHVRRHRRYRRNPFAATAAARSVIDGLQGGAAVVAGDAGAGAVSSLVPGVTANTPLDALVEVLVGFLGSLVLP